METNELINEANIKRIEELELKLQEIKQVARMTADELCGQPDTQMWNWTINRLRIIEGS
jgi:hypothetical protein